MGTLLRFVENYCAAVTKKYWALEKSGIVNLTIFVLFNFFLTTSYDDNIM